MAQVLRLLRQTTGSHCGRFFHHGSIFLCGLVQSADGCIDFKPFNDYYGYWRGDEMLRLLARLAIVQCDSQRDFLGHVGGDDQGPKRLPTWLRWPSTMPSAQGPGYSNAKAVKYAFSIRKMVVSSYKKYSISPGCATAGLAANDFQRPRRPLPGLGFFAQQVS